MPCVRQRWCSLHIFSRPLNLYLPAYLYIYYLWCCITRNVAKNKHQFNILRRESGNHWMLYNNIFKLETISNISFGCMNWYPSGGGELFSFLWKYVKPQRILYSHLSRDRADKIRQTRIKNGFWFLWNILFLTFKQNMFFLGKPKSSIYFLSVIDGSNQLLKDFTINISDIVIYLSC